MALIAIITVVAVITTELAVVIRYSPMLLVYYVDCQLSGLRQKHRSLNESTMWGSIPPLVLR